MQIPGIDYVIGKDYIAFNSPPEVGRSIHVSSQIGTHASIWGDGTTFVFPMMTDLESYTQTMNILNDAVKYYRNPAVADLIEQLRVVVELVKQHG